MVAAERFPVLPPLCAAGAGVAFAADAGAALLKMAESSDLRAAICSKIARPRWSWESVGVFISWSGSTFKKTRQDFDELTIALGFKKSEQQIIPCLYLALAQRPS